MAPDRPEVIALLTDCKEHPEDDTPRLVLADWLEERDDPRGSFLRAQVEAARRPEGDPERSRLEAEADALRLEHEAEWLGPLRPHLFGWEFARGLVRARATGKDLLDAEVRDTVGGESLAWVEGFRLFDAGPSLPTLTRCGLFDAVGTLSLMYNRIGDAALRAWLGTAPLPLLQELDLFCNQLGPASAQALAATEHLPALRRLNVGDNPLGDTGLFELAWPRYLRELETLQLERTGLQRVIPRGPTGTTRLPALQRLDLQDNDFAATDLNILLRHHPFPPLRRLALRGPRLGHVAALALAGAGERVARLEWLSLPGCGLTDPSAEALADCAALGRVHTLMLEGNQLTIRGVLALLHSPHLVSLRVLSLQDMHFSAHADLDALLSAPRLEQLQYLASVALRFDSVIQPELRSRYPSLIVE